MTITQYELEELLKREDEVTLLELLDISSEEIVEKFKDRIEYYYDDLVVQYDYTEIEENPFFDRF
jgi:hypothetical protein